MKQTFRTPALIFAAALFFGGTVAIQASPACQRLVRRYSEKVLHHKPSKDTLLRWAEWGKSHPDYHPPVKRKPRLSPSETYSKVAFDCEVPLGPTVTAFELPLDPMLTPDLPSIEVAGNIIPEIVPPAYTLVGTPIVNPAPVITDTPEPASIVFLATGFGMLLLLRLRSASFWRAAKLAA